MGIINAIQEEQESETVNAIPEQPTTAPADAPNDPETTLGPKPEEKPMDLETVLDIKPEENDIEQKLKKEMESISTTLQGIETENSGKPTKLDYLNGVMKKESGVLYFVSPLFQKGDNSSKLYFCIGQSSIEAVVSIETWKNMTSGIESVAASDISAVLRYMEFEKLNYIAINHIRHGRGGFSIMDSLKRLFIRCGIRHRVDPARVSKCMGALYAEVKHDSKHKK